MIRSWAVRLALYDVASLGSGEATAVDIVYLVVGKMTRRLAAVSPAASWRFGGRWATAFHPRRPSIWSWWRAASGRRPFWPWPASILGLRRYGDPPREVPTARKVTLCYGCRSSGILWPAWRISAALGVEVRLSTDDGSAGPSWTGDRSGWPGDRGSRRWRRRLVCCGPEAMLAATARLAERLGAPCQVSLESPMACGIGVCFSCVAKIRDDAGHWDYRRTCVEGPIFDSQDVAFE